MKTVGRKQRSSLGQSRKRTMGPTEWRISVNRLDCLRECASPVDDAAGVGGEQ